MPWPATMPPRQIKGQDVGPQRGVAEDPATGAAPPFWLAAGAGCPSATVISAGRLNRVPNWPPELFQGVRREARRCSRLDPRRRRLGYSRRRQLHRPLGNSMAIVSFSSTSSPSMPRRQPVAACFPMRRVFRHLDAALCEGTEFSETTFVLPPRKPAIRTGSVSSHDRGGGLRRTPEYRHRYCSRQRTSRRQPRIR